MSVCSKVIDALKGRASKAVLDILKAELAYEKESEHDQDESQEYRQSGYRSLTALILNLLLVNVLLGCCHVLFLNLKCPGCPGHSSGVITLISILSSHAVLDRGICK